MNLHKYALSNTWQQFKNWRVNLGQIRIYHICPRFTPQFLHFWNIFTMRKFVQINKSAIPMICFLIDHRNDVKLFKTKVEARATGEWFHCNVWSVLTSFLWSIKSTDHGNCCRFVFTRTLTVSDVHFRWRFSKKSRVNKLRHHLCTLIHHSSRPISVREIAQLF